MRHARAGYQPYWKPVQTNWLRLECQKAGVRTTIQPFFPQHTSLFSLYIYIKHQQLDASRVRVWILNVT